MRGAILGLEWRQNIPFFPNKTLSGEESYLCFAFIMFSSSRFQCHKSFDLLAFSSCVSSFVSVGTERARVKGRECMVNILHRKLFTCTGT